jgi:hypothetical protein
VFGAEPRDIDQIAEYADSSIRQMVRTGSLAPITGRAGLRRWRRQVRRPRAGGTAWAVAFLWLAVFGLVGDPSAIETGFTGDRVACVALSLASTGGLLRLLRAAHPPAGATTVIVSIGLLTTVGELAALLAGVLILSVAAWSLNRALGLPAPMWTGGR